MTGDVVDLFHYLTGRSRKQEYRQLLVAPGQHARPLSVTGSSAEVDHHQAGRPARIIAKMNQLEDPANLPSAGGGLAGGPAHRPAGARFLHLRPAGAGHDGKLPCPFRDRPVPGAFRAFITFATAPQSPLDGEFFIGSADWMSRNLSNRVEAIAPVEARPLRQRLWEILEIMRRRPSPSLGPAPRRQLCADARRRPTHRPIAPR